jgi:hypothetical protein
VPAILNEAVPATTQSVDGEIQSTLRSAYKYTGKPCFNVSSPSILPFDGRNQLDDLITLLLQLHPPLSCVYLRYGFVAVFLNFPSSGQIMASFKGAFLSIYLNV